jgi:hypothetical protein
VREVSTATAATAILRGGARGFASTVLGFQGDGRLWALPPPTLEEGAGSFDCRRPLRRCGKP